MDEQIKRFFFTGIGLVSLTLETLRDTVEELVKNKKISQEEGQHIISDFLAVTRPKRDDFEKQLQQIIDRPKPEIFSQYKDEISHLRNRISELESRMGNERISVSGRRESFRQRQYVPLVKNLEDVTDKVVRGARASLGDAPLTPDRKMEAEMRRMQQIDRDPALRSDIDNQRASLGGPILTPERKVREDSDRQKEKH